MQSKLQFISGPITYSHTGVNTPQGVGITSYGTGAGSYGTVQQHVMINNNIYPVLPSQPTPPQPTPYMVTYDPMEDIRAWYCVTNLFEHQVDISISNIINNVVWEREEFDTWFDTHCRDKVYVQRTYADGWRLFFVSRDDWFDFTTWHNRVRGLRWTIALNKFTDETLFNVSWQERNKHEQLADRWLKENAIGKFKVMRSNNDVQVEFQNEQDAVMMKLAWSDGCPYIEKDE
jgi:hypothetical protein